MRYIGRKPQIDVSELVDSSTIQGEGLIRYNGSGFEVVDDDSASSSGSGQDDDSIASLGTLILQNTANIAGIEIIGVND